MTTPQVVIEPTEVESLLRCVADSSPVALYAPDRYVLQVRVNGQLPEQALGYAVGRWRRASADVGLTACELVRAEVLTPRELDAEFEAGFDTNPNATLRRVEALEAVYETTRALLHIDSPADATKVLVGLVHRLGGSIVVAGGSHPHQLPFDLSLGHGFAMAPAAPPRSTPRQLLEELLPGVLADANAALGGVAEPVGHNDGPATSVNARGRFRVVSEQQVESPPPPDPEVGHLSARPGEG